VSRQPSVGLCAHRLKQARRLLAFLAPAVLPAVLLSLAIVSPAEAQLRPFNYEGPTLFQWREGEVVDEADAPDVIIADRPDFTNSPVTVGKGTAQVEAGYTFAWDDVAGQSHTSHSLPEVLLRLGVIEDWLELRLAWNYGLLRQQGGGHFDEWAGAQDLYLGAKIALTPQTGVLPATAIMPQMTVPTGSSAFTAGRTLAGVSFLYAWDVTDWLAVSASTQVNGCLDGVTANEYAQWAQSLSLGYGLSETTNAYTEWYVIAPMDADTDRTVHYLNGGLAHRLSDDFQVDIRIGKGLSAAGSDWFSGLGAAYRF
jgi:hypothetical protein